MSNQNPGCLSFLFPFLKGSKKEEPRQVKQEQEIFPYVRRDDFLSQAEGSFYKTLRQAIGETLIICPKVGMENIFFVKSQNRSEFMTYYNKINRKHVDFLLCDAETIKPVCGIELDDPSNLTKARIEREKLVDEIFKVSNLPLLRFKTKSSYSVTEIKDSLSSISNTRQQSINQETPISEMNNVDIPMCPKCNVDMVKRIVGRGENIGKEFYGCPNFPKCRHTKGIIN